MTSVEVCPICDIAGCRHIRERRAKMTDDELDALVEYLRGKGFISQREAEAISALRTLPAVQPTVSPDVAALVDDAGLLLDAYKAVLVLHRVMEKHGLTAGASAAENIADRIVAAHPEFPGLSALRGAAIARVKGGGR